MKNTISKTNFIFYQLTHGVYRVSYQSLLTGKTWSNLITDMELIDATKNKDYPTKAALNRLKRVVKNLPTKTQK